MKKLWCFFMAILLAFCLSSCASKQGTIQEEPHTAASFETVYDTYRPELILEGAGRYKVVKGDTLSAITRRQYGAGNGYFFPLIMLASSDVVLDPDLIEPDMILAIPDLQRNLDNPKARGKIKAFLIDIAGIYEQKASPVTQRRLLELATSL
jgi:hypothetical protein